MTDLEREQLLLTVPEITFEVAVIGNEILYMFFVFFCWHNTCNSDQIMRLSMLSPRYPRWGEGGDGVGI